MRESVFCKFGNRFVSIVHIFSQLKYQDYFVSIRKQFQIGKDRSFGLDLNIFPTVEAKLLPPSLVFLPIRKLNFDCQQQC